ncbi:MAG: dihydrofolate reductase [Bacteroidia bacterium]|nr:MAG: dihydrofolate reductase [Bacteroidia bacterium]
MKLIIIAALNRKRVIGKDGRVPWHIPEDLKRLKRLTIGHTLLMGRRTYESLQTPLPNRRHVVLTSRELPGIETYRTIPEALEALRDQEKVFIFGGGEIFSAMLEMADEWYLTHVDDDQDGDAFFPPYEHLVGTKYRVVGEELRDGYKFVDYKRADHL